MPRTPWNSDVSLEDLDTRMENAFRRVSGSIGFSLSRDRGNTSLLKDVTAQAFETGMDSSGPWFLRVGRGALEFGGFRPGAGVSLKDISGEILHEFFAEGNAAYQVVKTTLYTDALRHIREQGETGHSLAILEAAEAGFSFPSKDAFTREALPLVGQGLSPAGQAFLAGGAATAAMVMLIRAPIPALFVGAIAAGVAYYMARARYRRKAEELLRRLPKRLYDLLRGGLKTNISRYEEVVNTGLAGLNAG